MTAPPRVPAGIGDAGRKLWRAITREHELDGRETAILAQACRQADALADMDAALVRDGIVVPGAAGQPRLNAIVAESRQARLALAKLLDLLHLPDDDAEARKNRPQQRRASRRWGSGG